MNIEISRAENIGAQAKNATKRRAGWEKHKKR